MNDLPATEYALRREAGIAPQIAPLTSGFHSSDASASGVSWGAVLAGALVAAAVALILAILGVGLGLSSVSPWSAHATAGAIGVSAIIWLLVSQAIASGLGGYLAGRLRVKWAGVHTDEVYFRDTAHGFLAWAVGVVITAAFLVSAVSSVIGTTTRAATGLAGVAVAGGAAVAAGAVPAISARSATGAGSDASGANGERVPSGTSSSSMTSGNGYIVDVLMRGSSASSSASSGALASSTSNFASPNTPQGATPEVRAEATRVLLHAVAIGNLSDADRSYLAQLVSARTGVDSTEASTRVDNAYNQARALAQETEAGAVHAADLARSAAAKASLWIFVALLLGAFLASLAATLGGRQRDSDLALGV